jgi:predicted ATPase
VSVARPPTELLERDDELATLTECGSLTSSGHGGLVVVEGTAGIGKTRLLAAARAQAAEHMRVLSARGGELEGDFPFGVLRQLFEPLLAGASPDHRAELTSGAASLALPLFDATGAGWLPRLEAGGEPVPALC